jgi:hypothetical protein
MKMQLDYQVIVNLVGEFLTYSLPIGVVIGLTEKLCNLFFSMAFGNKKVNL